MYAPQEIEAWFAARIPGVWFDQDPEVRQDRDEIIVVGTLPDTPSESGPADPVERIRTFREETRERRIEIARELEAKTRQKVGWGVRIGEEETLFTHIAAPVMTRLRQPDRLVLDTLVEAGVARSRSDALAWCVRFVGDRSDSWLAELREAMTHVEEVRRKGPSA